MYLKRIYWLISEKEIIFTHHTGDNFKKKHIMKFTLFFAVSAIMFCSCSKVYDCQCKNEKGDAIKTFEVSSNSKSASRDECVSYGDVQNSSQTVKLQCELK